MPDDAHNELKATFFSSINSQMNKCLEKSMTCKQKAIRAHSVQNARVLDLLCDAGHVIQIKLDTKDDAPPTPAFKPIGRKQATTFAGLCSEHDRTIFEDIDTAPIDMNNKRQMFLLSYRAILRELHTTMDAAVSIQEAYQKLIQLGLESKDQPSPAGMEAVFQMMKAWRTYRYKFKYDEIEQKETYDDIFHFNKIIATTQATVAASVLFGIGKYSTEKDLVGVILNIIPLDSEKTLFSLGYLPEHEATVRANFTNLFTAEGYYFNYLVSKLLLKNGENFVINPSYFNAWDSNKKEKILNYFTETMFNEQHDEENEHLYLF